jgi:hypothetical protein
VVPATISERDVPNLEGGGLAVGWWLPFGRDRAEATLADSVERALRATEQVLSESPWETIASTPTSVRELLAAGEPGEAYETLCVNLYEIDARLPPDIGGDLRRAAVAAGLDPEHVDLLLS